MYFTTGKIEHPYNYNKLCNRLKETFTRIRVRKEEDKVGVRRLVWLYSITQNHKTKVALLACLTKAQLSTIMQFPGFLQFSEQSVCTSLHPVSLSHFHDRQLLFLSGFSTPITAIRHRCSSFCTWPTYSPLISRCSLLLQTSLRPAPPPPISGEKDGHRHLCPRPARWYPSCGRATAGARGPIREWILIPGDNSGGWELLTGWPSIPSQWCCTSSLS